MKSLSLETFPLIYFFLKNLQSHLSQVLVLFVESLKSPWNCHYLHEIKYWQKVDDLTLSVRVLNLKMQVGF